MVAVYGKLARLSCAKPADGSTDPHVVAGSGGLVDCQSKDPRPGIPPPLEPSDRMNSRPSPDGTRKPAFCPIHWTFSPKLLSPTAQAKTEPSGPANISFQPQP